MNPINGDSYKVPEIDPENLSLLGIRDYIERETGITYYSGRIYQLINRVGIRIRERKLESIEEYSGFLFGGASGRSEFERLLELLTVKETSFFRNELQFHVLKEYIIPAVVSNKEFAADYNIRVWSAGCATGQEPYTLAMIFLDAIEDRLPWRIKIYATDISRKALDVTTRGVYKKGEVKSVPPHFLEKYFTKRGEQYTVITELRDIVQPGFHNLMEEPTYFNVDIIFCRNVLIYFSVPTIRKITDLMCKTMSDSGFLFLGHSESLYGINDKFRLVDFAGLLVYRKKDEK